MPMQHKNHTKNNKKKQQRKGISLTIMDHKSIYSSIYPSGHPTKRLGLIRMTTYTECAMKQEFLNSWNCIPMVMMVMSRACSLRDPTQQDFINVRTLPIYKCHTHFKF